MIWRHIAWLAQQQPPVRASHTGKRFVAAQPIGLVYPYPVDHFPAVLGNEVKQIVDDFSLPTVVLHFQVEGGVNIHGDGADATATPWPG